MNLLVEYHYSAANIPPHERGVVATTLDFISDTVWVKDRNYWQNHNGLFAARSAITLATCESKKIGFLVYERHEIECCRVIYVTGINVIPEYQSRNVFVHLARPSIQREVLESGTAETYLALRTRSPIILSICERLCSQMVPSEGLASGSRLDKLAKDVFKNLMPSNVLDQKRMVIKNAYQDFAYRQDPHYVKRSNYTGLLREHGELGLKDAIYVFGKLSSECRALFPKKCNGN